MKNGGIKHGIKESQRLTLGSKFSLSFHLSSSMLFQKGLSLLIVFTSANETMTAAPTPLSLSSLNALVDDDFRVFRQRGLAVEAIGYFYLMHQFVHKETSFWKPYLDTLPAPTSEHRTPFWFDSDDLAWLEDTDVLFTYKARLAMHEGNYSTGTAMISQAGIDVTPYSW